MRASQFHRLIQWAGLGTAMLLAAGWGAYARSGTPTLASQAATTEEQSKLEGRKAPSLPPELRGDIMMARKEYPLAVEFYQRALQQSGPNNPVVWNKLGIAFQQQMNFRDARKAYQRSVHYRRDYAEAWNNLGTTWYLVSKYKKSLKFYRRAVKLTPNSAPLQLNIGTAYYWMRKYKDAVEHYRTALSLDPDILRENSAAGTVVQAHAADMGYYYYMAKVFASLGRSDEAVRYLRHALEDGFSDFRRLDNDPDFTALRKDPAYIALRENPPMPIKD